MALTVYDLTCEYQPLALGVARQNAAFGWKLKSDHHGAGSQNLAFLGSAPGLWILSLRYTCDGLDQLASTTKGSRTITYTYNGDGTRNTKTVDTTTTQYYYVNGRLQALTKDIYTAFFLYDDTGRPYNTREPSPCVTVVGYIFDKE